MGGKLMNEWVFYFYFRSFELVCWTMVLGTFLSYIFEASQDLSIGGSNTSTCKRFFLSTLPLLLLPR